MEVFVKKSAKNVPGLNLGVLLGLKKEKLVKGEVGIEIEVEGKNLPSVTQEHAPAPWVYKADHSLRGDENGEYVLKAPIKFSDVPGTLSKLWDHFEKCKTKFDDSNRTSVHIHLNCQDFHLNRLTAFCALHFILEEVLTEWCGEHRVGNLFCLRAKDAEAIITWLKKFIQNDGEYTLPEGLHYAGLNAQALQKFGSIEIRTLRGVSDPNVIQDWVRIYERLYKLSAEFKNPEEICDWFSANGPTAFFERILGDVSSVVKAGAGMTGEEIADSMYSGIRRAQDICFCRDWSTFRTVNVKDNPFGYSRKKLVQKAMQASGFDAVEQAGETDGVQVEYDEFPVEAPPTINWHQYLNAQVAVDSGWNQGEL